MTFAAALFDLDGTILDTVDLILASYRHTFAAHGLAIPSPESVLAGMGTPLEEGFGKQVSDPKLIEAMVETYRQHNHAGHAGLVRAYAGIPELISALTIPKAIVTSKRRDGTQLGLQVAGLLEAFDVWVCAEDVARRKPHPDPVLRALELLGGIDPTRAIFVGDAIHDVFAGRAAGVRTAAVLWGAGTRAELAQSEPDYLVASVADLRAILGLAPAA